MADKKDNKRNKGDKPKRVVEEGSGVVKQVLSGDRVVVYVDGPTKGPWSPPREKEIKLTSIKAPIPPRYGQNPQDGQPFSWQSKNYLRELIAGKKVKYALSKKNEADTSNRQYGNVYLDQKSPENDVGRMLVKAGWAVVSFPTNKNAEGRERSLPDHIQDLVTLQDAARSAKLGVHADSEQALEASTLQVQRNVDASKLFSSVVNKPIKAIVDYILLGSKFRVVLLPGLEEILFSIAGVKCPQLARKATDEDEPHAVAAQFTAEKYLLQREVDLTITAIDDKGRGSATFYGELKLNGKDIAELLLSSGLGRVVNWSIPKGREEALYAAQSSAQDKKERIWSREGSVQKAKKSTCGRTFTGRVKEVMSATSMVVQNLDITDRIALVDVTLSSISVPRLGSLDENADPPFSFEAREFVRKRLIGKKVTVTIDYTKESYTVPLKRGKGKGKENEEESGLPKEKVYPAKDFHTVLLADKNVALALVELGYADVVQPRGEERSPYWGAQVIAEQRAIEAGVGKHGNPKNFIKHRSHDISRNKNARSLLRPLIRPGERQKGVVEYVFSGSRMKIRTDDDNGTLIFSFFFSSVKCEGIPNKKKLEGGAKIPPFAAEARDYVKDLCLHRDVEFMIEGADNYGSAKGQLWVNKRYIPLLVVEKGFGKYTPSRMNTSLTEQLENAQTTAQLQKIGIWFDYDPEKEIAEKKEHQKRQKETTKAQPKKLVQVTEVLDGGFCYLQFVDEGQQKLAALMEQIAAQDWDSVPPHLPKVGELVIAKFAADNTWYRAEVIGVQGDSVTVRYGDYGNSETVDKSVIRGMASGEFSLSVLPFQAHPAVLAFIQPRTLDQDWGKEAADCFKELVWGKTLYATVPYTESYTDKDTGRKQTTLYVTLVPADDNKVFVNGVLVAEGLAKVDKRANRKDKIIGYLFDEQESAFKNRYGLWEYGDDGSDDEPSEFGAKKEVPDKK